MKIVKIIVLIIWGLITIGLLMYGMTQTKEAKRQREIAIEQRKIAEEQREESIRQREIAIEQVKIAEEQHKKVLELKEKLDKCLESDSKE